VSSRIVRAWIGTRLAFAQIVHEVKLAKNFMYDYECSMKPDLSS